MENKIWAPWRMDYIQTPKVDGCVFCNKAHSDDDKKDLVLFRGKESYVLMNLYPYSNCHILITPYGHTADTNSITPDGNKEIMWLANQTMNILKLKVDADGFNFGANIGKAGGAGIEEHLHYHIVPRWNGDTNFMPVVGNTKVIVEGLMESWEKLRPHFDKLKETENA
jgi:ATP adenylyltransferase|tara:strand:+ start:290 stop:793 length:504 start_codon:yes stop_codon:yes gene_type:complete